MRRYVLLLPAALAALGGCAVFDFNYVATQEVSCSGSPCPSMAEASALANSYQAQYAKALDSLSNGPQIFELPIAAAGVAAGVALLAHAHPDAAIYPAVGAGGVGLLSAYYAPRQRARIFQKGLEGMGCLKDLARSYPVIDINK